MAARTASGERRKLYVPKKERLTGTIPEYCPFSVMRSIYSHGDPARPMPKSASRNEGPFGIGIFVGGGGSLLMLLLSLSFLLGGEEEETVC